jgi:dihydroorotase
LRVAFHAEDRGIIERSEAGLRASGRTDAAAHLEARPATAEVAAIDRIGRILLDTQAGGHILHVSSAGGLAAVARWRERGADLTCEVTPQHLFLGRDVYETAGGIAKVNPPIRGGTDAAELLNALAEGRIDTVGSDHAPHRAAEKRAASIWDVPSGFAGVETLVPLLLTHSVNSGRMTLEQFVRVSSEGPAKAWSLYPRKGAIEIGSDADFTILDLHRNAVIRAQHLHGKNNLSPFEGQVTKGAPVATIVRGRVVMRDRELVGAAAVGRPVI